MVQPTEEPTDDWVPVVGVGGSAGSLQSLQAFVAGLPSDSGAAIVIVTHHPEDEPSLLTEILAPEAAIPVQDLVEGEPLAPNRAYVVPPGGSWALDGDGALRRQPSTTSADATAGRDHGHHYPVDRLLRSLASVAGHRSIGVILSGMGSDGTLGVKAIKSQGGLVMVEDPGTAGFDAMPASAIATGLADVVLPAADLGPALAQQVDRARQGLMGWSPAASLADDAVAAVFQLVREQTGQDFSGYKRNTIRRRVSRRMAMRGISDVWDYLAYMREHRGEIDLLVKEILISVTNFSRDPPAWDALAAGPLWERLQAVGSEGLRAWVVGCASGEEAYTLAMMIRECLEAMDRAVPVQIFASDVDQDALEVARVGRYPAGIAADLSPERLARHFVAEEDTYRVSRELREMIVFAEHNLLQDPPFIRMDLICCRNLLIYLEREVQRDVIPLFQYCLRPAGGLLLGPSEMVDPGLRGLDSVDGTWRIYQKSAAASEERPPGLPWRRARREASGVAPNESGSGLGLGRCLERWLAMRFAPSAVVIDDADGLLYVHGHTGQFLEPASGAEQRHLLSMARPGLRQHLADLLRRSRDGDEDVVSVHAAISVDGQRDAVTVSVHRIRQDTALGGTRVVTFETEPTEQGARADAVAALEPAPAEDDSAMGQLRRQLAAAEQDKRVSIQQLQEANQELQTMNEELQSSNEEIEVSKEEVESLNEELRSVNAKLEAKVRTLSHTNDDFKNLLESTDIAVLFLHEDMAIRGFTEAARDLLAVRDSDIGRPIDELATNLDFRDLTSDAASVLTSLAPMERTVKTRHDRWYQLRIMPYRTAENIISGVVCTFHATAPDAGEASPSVRWQALLAAAREPMVVLGGDERIVCASEAFAAMLGSTASGVAGEGLFQVAEGALDHPEVKALLRDVLPQREWVEDVPLEIVLGETDAHFRLNGRRLAVSQDDDVAVVLAMTRVGGAQPPGDVLIRGEA